MLDLTVSEIARWVDGRLCGAGEGPVREVVTDSRRVGPGSLFVALVGARTDGHRFLEEVAAAGAAAALVQADRGPRPAGLPCIVVPDPLRALGELARQQLARLGCPVFAVTGTVGKTSAKDLLFQLLGGAAAAVHAAPASYNSEIGLPLAVLGAPRGTRRLVLEYGVNAPGEMERLLRIAPPDQGLLTALGPAHLEGMGDLATVIREKGRLARACAAREGLWTFPEVLEVAGAEAEAWQPGLRVVGIGAGATRLVRASPGDFELELPRLGRVRAPLCAPHEAAVLAAGVEIAQHFGVPAEALRSRIAKLERPPGRLQLRRAGSLRILDDSYNSSPLALAAALEVLAAWPGSPPRVAVLGAMLELGPDSDALHEEAGVLAARLPLDLLLGVGTGGARIAAGARAAGATFPILEAPDSERAAALMRGRLRPGSVVLLKASRALRLERLLSELKRGGPTAAAATTATCPGSQQG